MLMTVVILAVWVCLSIPMAVVLGVSLRSGNGRDLVGMDGDTAVYRRADGRLERVSLVQRTTA